MRIFGRKLRFRDAWNILLDRPGDCTHEQRKHAEKRLRSGKCGCGEKKHSMRPFCADCHRLVPKDLRVRLDWIAKRRFVLAFGRAEAYLSEYWEAKHEARSLCGAIVVRTTEQEFA